MPFKVLSSTLKGVIREQQHDEDSQALDSWFRLKNWGEKLSKDLLRRSSQRVAVYSHLKKTWRNLQSRKNSNSGRSNSRTKCTWKTQAPESVLEKERCWEIRGIFPTSSFFPILEVNWPRFSLISLQMMLGTMRLKLFWSRSQKKIVPYEFVKQHIVMWLRGCSQFFDQLTNLDSIFTK